MNTWTDQHIGDVIEISEAVRRDSTSPDLIVEEYSQWRSADAAVQPSWNHVPRAAA